jgi:hypothetical protein
MVTLAFSKLAKILETWFVLVKIKNMISLNKKTLKKYEISNIFLANYSNEPTLLLRSRRDLSDVRLNVDSEQLELLYGDHFSHRWSLT